MLRRWLRKRLHLDLLEVSIEGVRKESKRLAETSERTQTRTRLQLDAGEAGLRELALAVKQEAKQE